MSLAQPGNTTMITDTTILADRQHEQMRSRAEPWYQVLAMSVE